MGYTLRKKRCIYCGAEFSVSSRQGVGWYRRRRYCSQQCYWKHCRTPEEIERRFWDKVRKTDTCWVWTAALDGNGYGNFWTGQRNVHAHIFSYRLLRDYDPKLVLDHLCRNILCVNPEHLEPVTNSVNLLRGERARMRTECHYGHPYSEYAAFRKSGWRYCKRCAQILNKKAYQRRKLNMKRSEYDHQRAAR